MLLIPGETLDKALNKIEITGWHGQWLSMAYQLVDAVYFMHVHNVVHRDLKPDNIQWDAVTKRLTLLDLGSACCVNCQDSCVGQYTGTPGFMAPDILALKRRPGDLKPWYNDQVDLKAADMFSLGVTLLETLLLEIPVRFDSVDEVYVKKWLGDIDEAMKRLAVDAELQELLTGLTSLDQKARPEVADVRANLAWMMITLGVALPAFDTRAPASESTAARYRIWGQVEPNCVAHVPCLQEDGTVISRSYGMPLDEGLSRKARGEALVKLQAALKWLHDKGAAHHALGLEYIFWDGKNLQLVPGAVPHTGLCTTECFSRDETALKSLIDTYFNQSPPQ